MAILTEEKKQFQKEQDQLLKTMLDLRYFNPWRNLSKYNNERAIKNDTQLELFITADCNQNCEYCYLKRYDKLYPKEFRNSQIILKNLQILYDYILENQFQIPVIDFFSGEIWHSQFGHDILDITLEYIKKGMSIGYIMITSNCFFINQDESLQTIQSYINQFRSIDCPLIFSISVDGKVIDDLSRPRVINTPYTDDFYDKLFAFAKVNDFYFHPMVAASTVHYWIDNYEWWKQMIHYYGMPDRVLMTLEVRNDGWTDENIQDYCNFMKYLMDEFMNDYCHGDAKLFGNAVVAARQKDEDPHLSGYIPWCIGPVDTYHGCTISQELVVRVGDLAICPCHRTAYEEYLYGKFVVENNKIVDIKAINPEMAVKVIMSNLLTSDPVCSQCEIKEICLHGCLGSQLETMKDPFFPIPNICKFFKTKYKFILKYYKDHGIIDYLKTYSMGEPCGYRAALILQLYDRLEEEINNELGVS